MHDAVYLTQIFYSLCLRKNCFTLKTCVNSSSLKLGSNMHQKRIYTALLPSVTKCEAPNMKRLYTRNRFQGCIYVTLLCFKEEIHRNIDAEIKS